MKTLVSAAMVWAGAVFAASAPIPVIQQAPARTAASPGGQAIFAAQCAFCHGRDATGGAGGPDLTESELVAKDVNGDLIGPVVRGGRPEKGMPPFALSDPDLKAVVAYVHERKKAIDDNPGRRRKVSAEDISTGNAEAGKRYFEGPGGCTKCHSTTGDLAGIAKRYQGLALMQQMLNPTPVNPARLAEGGAPKPNPPKVTVTPPSGPTVTGSLVHHDEFTIALRDAAGWYRSWPTASVKYTIDDPLKAHFDQLAKYTDDDIHNLVAYLQTLK